MVTCPPGSVLDSRVIDYRWEWVRWVCPIRRRERMISTRRFGCGEDGQMAME